MGPAFDIAMMFGNMVLIVLFFWLLINVGFAILEQLYTAEARIIQEYASGYLSMANFAPNSFDSKQTFPKVSHILNILSEPQLIIIKVGNAATWDRQIGEDLFESSIKVIFTPRTPLAYTLSNAISLAGSCIDAECKFSLKEFNIMQITKKSDVISANILEAKS